MPAPSSNENEEKKEELAVGSLSDFFTDAISHIDDYLYRTPGVRYPGDPNKHLLDKGLLEALTSEGRDQLYLETNKEPTLLARREFLNYLKHNLDKFPPHKPPKSPEISLKDFIGKEGVKLFKKAIIEEMKSKNFRDASFIKSISKVEGDLGEWNTKRIIWIGGPSSVGKTEACNDVLKLLASKVEKTGNKQEIAVKSDGGIIRETSQMRSIIARLAEKMGFSIINDLHDLTNDVFDKCKGTKVRAKECVAEAAFASNLNIIKPETFTKSCPELKKYEDRIRKGNLNYRQVFVEIKRQPVDKSKIASIEKDLKTPLEKHIKALEDKKKQIAEDPRLRDQYPNLEIELKKLTDDLKKLNDPINKDSLIEQEINERERRFNDTLFFQGNYRAKARIKPEALATYPLALNFPPTGEHKAYDAGPLGLYRYRGVRETKTSGRNTYDKELYQNDPDKYSITFTVDTTFVGIENGKVKEVDRKFEGETHRFNVRLLNEWKIYWDTLRKDEKEKLLETAWKTYFNTLEIAEKKLWEDDGSERFQVLKRDKSILMLLKDWEKNLNLNPELKEELKKQIIDVKETKLSDDMNYKYYLDRLIGFDPHVTIPSNTQLTKELAEKFDNLATYDKPSLRKQIDSSIDFAKIHLSPLSLLEYAESKGFDLNLKAGGIYEKLKSDKLNNEELKNDKLTDEEKNQFLSDIKQHLFEQMIERKREYKKNAFEIKLGLCFKEGRNNEYQVDESQFKIKDLMQQYPEYISSGANTRLLQKRKWLDFILSRPTLANASQKAVAEATIKTVEEALGSSVAKGLFRPNTRITLYKKESQPVERKVPRGVYQLRVTSKEFEAKLPAIATENKNTQPTLESDFEKNISRLKAGEYAINFVENTDTNSKGGYFVEQAAIQADGKIKIQSTAQRLPPEINKTTIFSKALHELCSNKPLRNHRKADLVKIAHKLKLNKDLFKTPKKDNDLITTGLGPNDKKLLEDLGLNMDTIKKTLLDAYYKACGVEVNGKILPSPAYLNYAQKQCESLQSGKSGKIIKIRSVSNEDPMLMRAYVMVCTAKGWKFKNECKSLENDKEDFAKLCKDEFVKNYVMENISRDEPFHNPVPAISPAPGSIA